MQGRLHAFPERVEWGVPWGPHCAIQLVINSRPRSVHGNVLCVPKALPLEPFNANWNKLDEYEKKLAWSKARRHARQILVKQKFKTGVAILGKPSHIFEHYKSF